MNEVFDENALAAQSQSSSGLSSLNLISVTLAQSLSIYSQSSLWSIHAIDIAYQCLKLVPQKLLCTLGLPLKACNSIANKLVVSRHTRAQQQRMQKSLSKISGEQVNNFVCSQKIYWGPKCLVSKIFWGSKIFGSTNILAPKDIWV